MKARKLFKKDFFIFKRKGEALEDKDKIMDKAMRDTRNVAISFIAISAALVLSLFLSTLTHA